MIDAAHEAVSFDAYWTIDGRRDFQKAVRGTIIAAVGKATPKNVRKHRF
jgi:hypothetical protein